MNSSKHRLALPKDAASSPPAAARASPASSAGNERPSGASAPTWSILRRVNASASFRRVIVGILRIILDAFPCMTSQVAHILSRPFIAALYFSAIELLLWIHCDLLDSFMQIAP